jgi:hypothetical protein
MKNDTSISSPVEPEYMGSLPHAVVPFGQQRFFDVLHPIGTPVGAIQSTTQKRTQFVPHHSVRETSIIWSDYGNANMCPQNSGQACQDQTFLFEGTVLHERVCWAEG